MRRLLLGFSFLVGCAATQPELAVPEGGEPVYEGTVFGADGPPVFAYTRASEDRGDRLVSMHRSRDPASGQLVVEQAAEHTRDYALIRATEHHHQLGVRSEVVVEGDRLRMTTEKRGRVRQRTRRLDAPPVVGPTLFGFVLERWAALSEGEVIDVQFVVPEARSTYAFRLRMLPPQGQSTAVVMEASSALVRRFVPPMRITFDSGSRSVLRYEGWVPPRVEGRRLEARVEYRHLAEYR